MEGKINNNKGLNMEGKINNNKEVIISEEELKAIKRQEFIAELHKIQKLYESKISKFINDCMAEYQSDVGLDAELRIFNTEFIFEDGSVVRHYQSDIETKL